MIMIIIIIIIILLLLIIIIIIIIILLHLLLLISHLLLITTQGKQSTHAETSFETVEEGSESEPGSPAISMHSGTRGAAQSKPPS
jgi:hypothetical protein